jgi:hypothetical protein
MRPWSYSRCIRSYCHKPKPKYGAVVQEIFNAVVLHCSPAASTPRCNSATVQCVWRTLLYHAVPYMSKAYSFAAHYKNAK